MSQNLFRFYNFLFPPFFSFHSPVACPAVAAASARLSAGESGTLVCFRRDSLGGILLPVQEVSPGRVPRSFTAVWARGCSCNAGWHLKVKGRGPGTPPELRRPSLSPLAHKQRGELTATRPPAPLLAPSRAASTGLRARQVL